MHSGSPYGALCIQINLLAFAFRDAVFDKQIDFSL